MKILTTAIMALGLTASALGAQMKDPDKPVVGGGITVPGWTGRIDPQAANAGRKISENKVVSMGPGFHVTSGPAAIYWNPAITATGNYTVSASFSQTKAAMHPEAYGLMIGGNNLDTPNQSYLYFEVRQDGKYLINHRANDSTIHKIVDWTANDAVKAIDASGQATNALSIVVAPDKVNFLVNGVQVNSLPRTTVDMGGPGRGSTGIVGIRVNHNLDVHVAGFALTPTT